MVVSIIFFGTHSYSPTLIAWECMYSPLYKICTIVVYIYVITGICIYSIYTNIGIGTHDLAAYEMQMHFKKRKYTASHHQLDTTSSSECE